MKKNITTIVVGVLLVVIVLIGGYITLFSASKENNNKKIAQVNITNESINLKLGDEYFISDLSDIKKIRSVEFENNDTFIIDDEFIVHPKTVGQDNLIITYNDNTREKIKFTCKGNTVNLKIGEKLDYNTIGIDKSKIETITITSDNYTINGLDVTSLDEGKGILNITYKDGTEESIELNSIVETSNVSLRIYYLRFMCNSNEYCNSGNYGEFSEKDIHVVKSVPITDSIIGKNIIDNYSIKSIPVNGEYYFDGFYTEMNGKGTKYIDHDGNIIADDSNSHILYANWIENKCQNFHTLTFDCQGGKVNNSSLACNDTFKICFSAVNFYITSNNKKALPLKNGYIFKGYYTEKEGKGIQMVDETGKFVNDNLRSRTLYAYWTKNNCSNPHEITYDCQGGKDNGNGMSCAATLHTCTSTVGSYIGNNSKDSFPLRDGYIFKGFYTEKEGKGTQITDETGKYINDDLKSRTIYAYWTKNNCSNPHEITYDCQGGKDNGNGMSCAATLHTCTSTINSYIGNNSKDSFPLRDGYIFKGFYTEKEGKGTQITDETGKYINDDLKSRTIYAYWTKSNCSNPHNIKYDCQGGKDNGNGISCTSILNTCTSTVGSYIGNNAKDSFPIREGYIFKGFYTRPEGKGIKVTDETGKYINDDLKSRTIYAYWTKSNCSNPHNIKYDCQGGKDNGNGISCAATLQTCTSTVGSYIGNNAKDSIPIREGYTFKGFYTKKDGKGTKVTDETGKYINDDLNSKTIYAYWTKSNCSNPHEITYNCQGGKDNGNGISCAATLQTCTSTVGSYIGNNAKDSFPIREGYTFKGFYTKKDGKGTKVTDETGKYINDDLKTKIIYAYWEKNKCSNQHTIKYDCQGGKDNGNGMSCAATLQTCTSTVGSYIGNNAKDSIPIREGYTFKGFYTKKDGKGTKVTDGTGKYINDDLKSKTIYAYWNPMQIKVVFHSNISKSNDKTISRVYKSNDNNKCFGCNINGKGYELKATSSGFGNWKNGNYIFMGWSKQSTSDSISYSGNSNISLEFIENVNSKKYKGQKNKGVIDLYAIWSTKNIKLVLTQDAKINDKKISLSSNKKKGYLYRIGTNQVCYDAKCNKKTSRITVPTKAGYKFTGYYTKKSSGTKIINSNGTINVDKIISKNKSITLYAQWEK